MIPDSYRTAELRVLGASRQAKEANGMSGSRHVWALVLAAGDGARIAVFTRDASGRAVPKQYCSFGAPVSLLRRAIDRAARMVAADRLAIVVAEQHRPWWEEELAAFPPARRVIQPENKGTAIGLLLGVTDVLRHDPSARFIVFPSDHDLLATSLVKCWSPRRRGSRWWPPRPAGGLTWERPRGS
jgi:hypothetical protein